MKNVTLSADEALIERARLMARARNTTLNSEFREWLVDYTSRQTAVRDFDSLMREIRREVRPGRKFTRDEMNER